MSVESLADGRYAILEELGTGGMAVVYRARDSELDRDVAIKVLAEHLASDIEFRRRFLRESPPRGGALAPERRQRLRRRRDGRKAVHRHGIRARRHARRRARTARSHCHRRDDRPRDPGVRRARARARHGARASRRQAPEPPLEGRRRAQDRRLRDRAGRRGNATHRGPAPSWEPPSTSHPSRPPASRCRPRPTSIRSAPSCTS